jgi:hypothetical protein
VSPGPKVGIPVFSCVASTSLSFSIRVLQGEEL